MPHSHSPATASDCPKSKAQCDTKQPPQTGILTLNELVTKMKCPNQAAGGKHPASDRQKQIASQTIRRVKPWQKSTGPSTPAGKFVASLNVRPKPGRFTLSRLLDSRTAPDFEAECRRVDGLIEQVQVYVRKLNGAVRKLKSFSTLILGFLSISRINVAIWQ